MMEMGLTSEPPPEPEGPPGDGTDVGPLGVFANALIFLEETGLRIALNAGHVGGEFELRYL